MFEMLASMSLGDRTCCSAIDVNLKDEASRRGYRTSAHACRAADRKRRRSRLLRRPSRALRNGVCQCRACHRTARPMYSTPPATHLGEMENGAQLQSTFASNRLAEIGSSRCQAASGGWDRRWDFGATPSTPRRGNRGEQVSLRLPAAVLSCRRLPQRDQNGNCSDGETLHARHSSTTRDFRHRRLRALDRKRDQRQETGDAVTRDILRHDVVGPEQTCLANQAMIIRCGGSRLPDGYLPEYAWAHLLALLFNLVAASLQNLGIFAGSACTFVFWRSRRA